MNISILILHLCLFLNFALLPNIFLQKPKILSDQELNELNNNWETQFVWHYRKGCNFVCCYEKGESSFLLQIFGLPVRSYNFQYISNLKKLFFNSSKKSYYFAEPLKFENPTPKTIYFEEFVNLIKDKKFIFYTGAGISASAKISMMRDLEISLKLNNKKDFLKSVFLNPKDITKAFSEFCSSAKNCSPTKAHYAIHKISQVRNFVILTENVDLLQHKTGSEPLFVRTINSINDKDLREIDFIICVGLSHDDCGLLAYYKQKNPNGLIIAIDLGIPNYLSGSDYLIQENLQVVLSNLEKTIC